MASMDYWATAPIARNQVTLLAPTLDSMIADDAHVRILDEILAGNDWTPIGWRSSLKISTRNSRFLFR